MTALWYETKVVLFGGYTFDDTSSYSSYVCCSRNDVCPHAFRMHPRVLPRDSPYPIVAHSQKLHMYTMKMGPVIIVLPYIVCQDLYIST